MDSPEIILHTQILRDVHPLKSFNIVDIIYRCLYWVCILNFGVCSVFEFLAYEGMNGTTNRAVVDLSPYGFVFKELALQTLILNEFLSFLSFGSFVTNHFGHSTIILHTPEIILHNWILWGVPPGIVTEGDILILVTHP